VSNSQECFRPAQARQFVWFQARGEQGAGAALEDDSSKQPARAGENEEVIDDELL
jgi:hypothetical protein